MSDVYCEGSIRNGVLRAELDRIPGSYSLLSHCLLLCRNVTTEVHAFKNCLCWRDKANHILKQFFSTWCLFRKPPSTNYITAPMLWLQHNLCWNSNSQEFCSILSGEILRVGVLTYCKGHQVWKINVDLWWYQE